MMKQHDCFEKDTIEKDYEPLLTIAFNESEDAWYLCLDDGYSSMNTPIRYCPYCSKSLYHED